MGGGGQRAQPPRAQAAFVRQELTTVRVQDPRVQNEGSWNSYVDYKIFLHVSRGAELGRGAHEQRFLAALSGDGRSWGGGSPGQPRPSHAVCTGLSPDVSPGAC